MSVCLRYITNVNSQHCPADKPEGRLTRMCRHSAISRFGSAGTPLRNSLRGSGAKRRLVT